jgi:hypothetical protein
MGIFLPAPKPRLHELMIKKSATGIEIPGDPFSFIDSYQKDQ